MKVVSVNSENAINLDAAFNYKWVIQKVDLDGYQERLEKDKELKEMIAVLKNRKAKRSLMDELITIASPEEIAKLKELAGVK